MIKTTGNYTQFLMIAQNRGVNRDHPRVKNLEESMLKYGWLDAFPLMAKKLGSQFTVVDGQHRLAIAKEYGIPVKYVVENRDIDIPSLQKTTHEWTYPDYAKSYALHGLEDYQELIAFQQEYGISIQMSAAILANTSSFTNVVHAFRDGQWKIKNRSFAYYLADCYKTLAGITPVFKKSSSVRALWACMHVEYFDAERLIDGVTKRAASIRPASSMGLSLELMEHCYNFSRKTKYPLRFDAEHAMKLRSPIKRG